MGDVDSDGDLDLFFADSIGPLNQVHFACVLCGDCDDDGDVDADGDIDIIDALLIAQSA